GIFGYLGFNMSPATSGAVSIGIGIAIDFGIQTVSRYREELEESQISVAVSNTLKSVSRPMTIALVSAIIGFTSLSMGRLTFLSELGIVLSLMTVSAYIGAFTIIPTVLVLHEKYVPKNIFGGDKHG
ncbi:MAG: MMPL family transporter, partial [Candidatus Aenigmatarchaeota archaeon]